MNATVDRDQSCLLAKHDYLRDKRLLSIASEHGPCEPAILPRIPDVEKRGISKCFLLAEFADGPRVLAVEYARKGQDLLLALLLLTKFSGLR